MGSNPTPRTSIVPLGWKIILVLFHYSDADEILNKLNIMKGSISVQLKGKRALVLVGILLALLGTVFAFQGAGMLGTGGFMDNNPTYIYVGGALAILGLLLLAFGVIPRQGSQTVLTK